MTRSFVFIILYSVMVAGCGTDPMRARLEDAVSKARTDFSAKYDKGQGTVPPTVTKYDLKAKRIEYSKPPGDLYDDFCHAQITWGFSSEASNQQTIAYRLLLLAEPPKWRFAGVIVELDGKQKSYLDASQFQQGASETAGLKHLLGLFDMEAELREDEALKRQMYDRKKSREERTNKARAASP